MQKCPCCSGKEFTICCEPLLLGKQHAETPEQLMRSRYTAFAQRDVDYIFATMTGPALTNVSREETQAFVDHVKWTGLEIIDISPIKSSHEVNNKNNESDEKLESYQEGFVEFAAHYIEDDDAQILSERSRFIKKDNDKWFYISGEHKVVRPEKTNQISTKKNMPGRNDPCFCGSGKKYKKCCIDQHGPCCSCHSH